nr:GNAT family N-acetyltransferase [Streptococcus agalactiae]
MEIKEYENNPYHLAQLVDLINYCQNIEAKLDIKMAEQDDIFQIENYYQNRKGQFWLALENEKVVGSIALLRIDDKTAVLKKFFTYSKYRGNPVRLGRKLFERFMLFARASKSQELSWILQKRERSHFFYENQGFSKIQEIN